MTQIEASHKRNQIEFSVCGPRRDYLMYSWPCERNRPLPPVKKLLEEQGYIVRAEVDRCDLAAVRGGEPPVIVELKPSFALSLVYQGIERQRITDTVYLTVVALMLALSASR